MLSQKVLGGNSDEENTKHIALGVDSCVAYIFLHYAKRHANNAAGSNARLAK
jgi:hypothetical protein